MFVAPPGVGKTVVGLYLAAARGRNTLVLVHRKPLLDQWVAQLSLFLGLTPKAIGQIGGGKMRVAKGSTHARPGAPDVRGVRSRTLEATDFAAGGDGGPSHTGHHRRP